MPKRTNRIASIEHEIRQLQKLKELEPNATMPRHQGLSDALVDVCILALEEVRTLELKHPVNSDRLSELLKTVIALQNN